MEHLSAMGVRPVFIFSTSRSGSTLLQRILAAHRGVATTSEPWLMLPHAYTFRQRGVDAEYMHPLLNEAVRNFAERLPRGELDYREEVRELGLRLYAKAAGPDAELFIDKSPPYCLISDEIIELFPEAKFVFLWRNPLSVIASMIDTWGPWRPTFMTGDLFVGLPRLVASFEKHRDASHGVRFEDLVGRGARPWEDLTHYLGIEFEPESLSSFSGIELDGPMGDPTGRARYSTLSSEPNTKWRSTLANPVRREWCRRYLRLIGEQRLAIMGYSQAELLATLGALPPSRNELGMDLWQAAKGLAKEPVRVRTRNRRLGLPNVVRTLLRA